MNEILIVNKGNNCTSRDVVNFLCKKFGTKKIGHTGTLDPMATGVLVVLIGKYTNLVEVISAYDKTYEAEITLGLLTDTLDITGNLIKEEKPSVSDAEIEEILKSMVGTYEQTVPIYSAVKVKGKRLYEYARNNEEVELPKRLVNIKSIELIDEIKRENNKIIFKIRTEVSKGTYIRALVNDIALKLNTIGVMSSLNRIKQGNISIKDAYTLEKIENNEFEFYDLNKCLSHIKQIEMDELTFQKVKNGVKLENIYHEDLILFKYQDSNVAIYRNDNNILKMWKYLL